MYLFACLSDVKAEGEVVVVRKFFESYSGNSIRTMMRGFVQAGDFSGQRSVGYRWETLVKAIQYGRSVIIGWYKSTPIPVPSTPPGGRMDLLPLSPLLIFLLRFQ